MKQKQRITWLDTIKGICILFLIFSHCMTEFDILKTWIFSFMLPAFYMVCGYLTYYRYPDGFKSGQFSDLFSKRWFNLFIPYFFFGIILILYFNSIRLISGNPLLFISQFKNLILMKGIASLWFLPIYFFSEVLLILFLTLIKGKARYCIAIIIAILLIIIDQTSLSWPFTIIYKSVLGFVFAYAAFIFASYKIEKKLSIKAAAFLLLIGSISTSFNQGASVNDMKIAPLYFINALIICLSMITLVIYKDEKYGNNKFVSFYGKNCLLIVCTNNLIIEFLRLLDHLLFNDSLLQIGYLGIFIFFIIITACEYPILRFFEDKFSRDYFLGKN